MDEIIAALIQAAEDASRRTAAQFDTIPRRAPQPAPGLLPDQAARRVLKSLEMQEYAAWLEAAVACQEFCDSQGVTVSGAEHGNEDELLRAAYPGTPGRRQGFSKPYLQRFCLECRELIRGNSAVGRTALS